MDTASITRIEKGVDHSASALFGLACGYAAYAWFAGSAQEPVLGLEAAAAFVLGYLLSLRGLSSIRPEPRKVPVPIFDVREVEPMAPVERPVLDRVRPASERPIPEQPLAEAPIAADEPAVELAAVQEVELVDEVPVVPEPPVEPTLHKPTAPFEQFGAADSTELELNEPAELEAGAAEVPSAPESADEAPQDSRVIHLFDPASMPSPEEMISRIDRHLENQPSAAQSAEAAQALHEALAELRRSIR